MGEHRFWSVVMLDPFAIASGLYRAFTKASPQVSAPRNKTRKSVQIVNRPERKWPKGRKIANRRKA
jgi:hypothetical protein